MGNRAGYTLPEICLALGLAGIILGLAVPRFRHGLDVLAVRGARDALIGASARARSLGITRGAGALRIGEDAMLRIESRGTVVEAFDLGRLYGVQLDIEHSQREEATLHYDLIGVGRLANLTVRLTRSEVQGRITFSAYGRPREW